MLLLGICHFPAAAGTCDGRLTIWFQPGVDDSDRFLAEWPALSRELAARGIRWVRIDTTSLTNTVNARAHGIKRLPAFCYRGRWVQGYSGLAPLLAQFGLSASTPPITRPRGETPTYTPPVGQSTPEALDLQTFRDAIGLIEDDQRRQDAETSALSRAIQSAAEAREAAIATQGGKLEELAASLAGTQTQLVGLRQQSEARWAATEAGLAALAHVQQQLAAESRDPRAESPEPSQRINGSTHQRDLPENKGSQSPQPPEPAKQPGKWPRFLTRVVRIGLLMATPEVAVPTAGLTAGLTAAGWLAVRLWKRRIAEKHSAGRPEVRPADMFQQLAGSAISAGTELRGGAESAGAASGARPRSYERTETGWVRSTDGGPVPDRFADLEQLPSRN